MRDAESGAESEVRGQMAGEGGNEQRNYSVYLDLAWGAGADPRAWGLAAPSEASGGTPNFDREAEGRESLVEAMASALAQRSPRAGAAVGGGINQADGSVLDMRLSINAPDVHGALVRAVSAVEDAYAAALRAASADTPMIEERLPAFALRSASAEPEADAGRRRPVPELAGLGEIAQILGLKSRQNAFYASRNLDFPRPVAQLNMGKVWCREDVLEYKRKHERG